MKVRLFVAADIPQTLVKGFIDYQKSLSIKNFRLTREENFHLTIAFLGYINNENLDLIEKEIAAIAARTKPFQLHHESMIVAPPGKDSTMIWAKLAPSEEFANLAEDVYSNTKPYISEQIRTERIPHITLAGSRKSEAFNQLDLAQSNLGENSFLVDRIVLFESQPIEADSNYRRISTYALQG